MQIAEVVDELAGVAMRCSHAAVVLVRAGVPEFLGYDPDEAETQQRLYQAVKSGALPIAIVSLKLFDGIAANVEVRGLGGWNGPHARPFLTYCAKRFVRTIEREA